MERDYGAEIDGLQKEISKIRELLQEFMCGNTNAADRKEAPFAKKQKTAESEDLPERGKIEVLSNMHPIPELSRQMEELCEYANEKEYTGLIDYMGVFASGGRQSNWIRHYVDTDGLLTLIENHTAEKVLNCIGNSDRLNILLALLKKPRTVAELVEVCKLNSTGQVYHHMKPLLAADLIAEEEHSGKGIYIVQPHKVQGIIMLLAGICDMVDETFREPGPPRSAWQDRK